MISGYLVNEKNRALRQFLKNRLIRLGLRLFLVLQLLNMLYVKKILGKKIASKFLECEVRKWRSSRIIPARYGSTLFAGKTVKKDIPLGIQ